MSESAAQLLANVAHTPALSVPLSVLPVVLWIAFFFADRNNARWYAPRRVRIASACAFVVSILVSGTVGFHVGCAALKAHAARCLTTQKSLGQALMMYVEDYDETFPPTAVWPEAAKLGNQTCPSAETPFSYGFHDRLGAKPLDRLNAPAETPLLFDADATVPNFAGGRDAVAWLRHIGGEANVVLADGHARHVGMNSRTDVRWENLLTTR